MISKINKALHLRAISEVLHYNKFGSKASLDYFQTFFADDVDFKTENKIVRAIMTDNQALLENTINEVINEANKILIECMC